MGSICRGKSQSIMQHPETAPSLAVPFERARQAMELFPGAALCFATFHDKLNPSEKRRFRAIANAGRELLSPGHQRNPVTILTGKELFGQYRMGDFYGEYGQDERRIR